MSNPSNDFALGHLRMTPLQKFFPHLLSEENVLWQQWNRSITEKGLLTTIEKVLKPLQESLSDFARDRQECILDFLRSCKGDLESIVRQLENFEISVAESSAVIQVMTIHKSKGLGFDIVFVLELKNTSIINRRNFNKVRVDNDYGTSYLLPPVQWARNGFTPIREVEREWEIEEYFAAFCVLYVAVTRAKQALYCFLPKPTNKAGTRTEDSIGGWISEAVGISTSEDRNVLYQNGNSKWSSAVDLKKTGLDKEGGDSSLSLPQKRSRSTGGRKGVRRAAFSDQSALNQGTEVHELMELVEWLPALPADLPEEILIVLSNFEGGATYIDRLNQPDVRNLFIKPTGSIALFREQALEWIGDDGLWNTIRLDRFVVYYDATGAPEKIRLIDYKTDRTGNLQEKYKEQMQRYTEGLKAVFGEVEVEVHLVALGM